MGGGVVFDIVFLSAPEWGPARYRRRGNAVVQKIFRQVAGGLIGVRSGEDDGG
jgi:hypothetical protein